MLNQFFISNCRCTFVCRSTCQKASRLMLPSFTLLATYLWLTCSLSFHLSQMCSIIYYLYCPLLKRTACVNCMQQVSTFVQYFISHTLSYYPFRCTNIFGSSSAVNHLVDSVVEQISDDESSVTKELYSATVEEIFETFVTVWLLQIKDANVSVT